MLREKRATSGRALPNFVSLNSLRRGLGPLLSVWLRFLHNRSADYAPRVLLEKKKKLILRAPVGFHDCVGTHVGTRGRCPARQASSYTLISFFFFLFSCLHSFFLFLGFILLLSFFIFKIFYCFLVGICSVSVNIFISFFFFSFLHSVVGIFCFYFSNIFSRELIIYIVFGLLYFISRPLMFCSFVFKFVFLESKILLFGF
jgi:hypothetical protein